MSEEIALGCDIDWDAIFDVENLVEKPKKDSESETSSSSDEEEVSAVEEKLSANGI
jgi:hypothetical protein